MVRRSVVLSMFRGFVLLTVAWIASPPLHAQTYQVIHNFDPSSPVGTIPQGLTRDAAGNLFGTTLYALQYQGTVFKLDTTHTFTVLHTFTDPKDGAGGKGPLILDSAGNVYGTTLSGGDKDFGMVFKVDPTGVETVLHSFSGSTGKFPNALTRDPAGNLYGTTSSGLREGGVVFRINTFGTGRTLHRFTGPDGDEPGGGLARDSAGNLYGTTAQGGGLWGRDALHTSPEWHRNCAA